MSDESLLEKPIERSVLLRPGPITVGDPDRRRMLEDLGKADNPRIRFIDDAAEVGDE